jgi:hypothetical protein
MTESEDTPMTDQTSSEETTPRKRGWVKKAGITLLVLVGLLAVTGFVLYQYGSMEPPSAQMRAQYAALRTAGVAPAVQPAGFHVPIPGCKCHSTDPVQTLKHEGYTIRQCSSCHSRGGNEQASAAQ